jgi:hypothetical protein
VITPVLFNYSVFGESRPIETVFDVIEPDDCSTDKTYGPEPIALLTVRMLLALLGLNSNSLPKTQLSWRHSRAPLLDARPQGVNGNRLSLDHGSTPDSQKKCRPS